MKFKNIISYAGILIFLILFTSQHGIGVAQADPPMQKITNKPPIEHPTDIPDHETTKPGDAEMEIIKLNFLFNQLNGLLNQKDSLLKDIHKERKKINDNNLRLLSNHISALIEWGKRRDEAPEDIPAASMEPSSRKKTAKENIVSKVYKKDKFTADKTYLDTSNISGASTGISLQPDSEYADLKPTSDEWEGLKFHNTSRTLKDLLDQKTKLENEIHNLFFKKISPKIPSSDVETQIKHMTYYLWWKSSDKGFFSTESLDRRFTEQCSEINTYAPIINYLFALNKEAYPAAVISLTAHYSMTKCPSARQMWMLDYNYHDLLYRTIKMHDLVMTGAFVDDDRIERDIKKRVSRKTEDGKKKKGSLSLLLDKIGNLGSSLWQKMATPPTSVEAPSFDSDVDDAVGIFYAMNLNISLAFLTRNGGVFSLGQAFGCDTSPALVKWWRPARMSQLKNPAYKLGLFLYDRYEDELKSFDTLLPDGDVACTSKYKGELDEGHTGWGVPLKDVFSICQDMPEADTGNPPFNLALTRLYSLKGREINMRTPGQTALNDYSMICQPGGGGGGGGGTVEIACELPGGGSSQTCSPGGSATSWQAQASFGMNPIPKEMTVQFDKLMKNIICNEMWGPGPTPEGLPPADPQPGEDAPDSGEPGDPKDEDSEDDADEDTDEDEEADEDRDEEDDTDMGNDKGDKIGGKEETETGQESQDKVAQAPAWFVQAWATALNADEKTLNQIADGIMMIGGADITNNPEMWIEGLEFLLKRAATTVEKEMFLTGAYILGNGIVNPETGEKITLWVIEYDFEKFMEYNEETGKWELSCMAYFDTSDGKVHFSPAVLMLKDGAKLAGHEIGHGALFFVPGLSEAICPGDDSACFNTMHHIVTLYANVYGSYTGKGEMVKEFEEEYGIGKAPQGGGSSGGGGLHFGGSQQQLPLDSAAGVCDVDAILMGLHGFGCGPVYADETGGGPGGGDPLPPPIPWIGTTCMDPPCNDPMGPDSVASSSFNPCGVAGKGVVGSVSEEAMQCWAKDCNPVAMKEFKDMLGQETVPPFLQEKIKTGMPGEN